MSPKRLERRPSSFFFSRRPATAQYATETPASVHLTDRCNTMAAVPGCLRMRVTFYCPSRRSSPTAARAPGPRCSDPSTRLSRPRADDTGRPPSSSAGTWSGWPRPSDTGAPCRPGTRASRAPRTCPTRTSCPWWARNIWPRPGPRTAACNRLRMRWPPCSPTAVALRPPRPSR